MPEFVVGHRSEFAAGGRKLVEVAGRSIGVFLVEGQLYALGNHCADQGGPVCEGKLVAHVDGDIGPRHRIREFLHDRGCILACPWHGWEYDVRTGVALWDPRYRLARYEVREGPEGEILVRVGQ